MSPRAGDLFARATALRDAFDRTFTLPAPERQDAPVQVLRLQAAGKEWALRLDDIVGMHLDPHLARVPAAPRALLGLTTVRGRTWPVYDLSVLLGQGRQERPRVLCLLRGEPSAALACEVFRGLVHVRAQAIVEAPQLRGSRKAVQVDQDFLRLLELAELIPKNQP